MGCNSSTAADREAVGTVNPASLEGAFGLLDTSGGLTSCVELSISAVGLASTDVLSAPDPLVVVYEKQGPRLVEVGRTEVISNTAAPRFVQPIRITYQFESQQELVVRLYDVDTEVSGQSQGVDLGKQDFQGEMECALGSIMGSRGCTFTGPISNRERPERGVGSITVRGEEMRNANGTLFLSLAAEGLDSKDTLGGSDPFLRVSRVNPDGSVTPVFKTEVVMRCLSPSWKPVSVPIAKICNGDPDRPLLIECFDWDRDGTHDFIGSVVTSVADLVRRAGGQGVGLVNKALQGVKHGYVNSGWLRVVSGRVVAQPSFLDFISGGCELNFMVAVDFTQSNGDVSNPASLHYIDPRGFPNQYQMAIQAVGSVLNCYDRDQLFPVFGFGGVPPGTGATSHCFPLFDGMGAAACAGLPGILRAYSGAVRSVRLSGPTYFGPIINQAATLAQAADVSQSNQKYFVLLILTDGVINDFDATAAAIVRASGLPLSILIVGVGGANFSQMKALDGDEARLTSGGRPAVRDIVQFVALRDSCPPGSTLTPAAVEKVSRELLAEIPGQLLGFMAQAGITPVPRLPVAPVAVDGVTLGFPQPSAPPSAPVGRV